MPQSINNNHVDPDVTAYSTPNSTTTDTGTTDTSTSNKVTYPNDGASTIIESNPAFRSELVRLVLQSLRRYGYFQSASTLEKESGIIQEHPFVLDFRKAVLNGNWSAVEQLLDDMNITDVADLKNVRFLIYEQKFLELLDKRELNKALMCLRQELMPLKFDSDKLHKLSQLMMCRTSEDLREKARWSGANVESRQIVLTKLQKYISPDLMIPQHRLETLLEQATITQQRNCMYHSTSEPISTLLSDHSCDRNSIPREARQILKAHTDEVWLVKFSNDGTKLASASKDNNVIIWDVSSPVVKVLHTLSGHTDAICCVSWSPDDKFLLSSSSDRKLKLWNVKTGNIRKTMSKHTVTVSACVWVPDGQSFLSGGLDNKLYHWDLDGNILNRLENVKITDLAMLKDGKRAIYVTNENKVGLYYIGENRKEEIILESTPIISVSVSKDGNFLLLSLSSAELHLWNIEKRELVSTYTGHHQKNFVIRSCFGGENDCYIASGSEDNNVYIWHRYHGNLLETLAGHTGAVNTVAWNPKHPRMFASASDDNTIRIWGAAIDNVNSYKFTHESNHSKNGLDNGSSSSSSSSGSSSNSNNSSNNSNNSSLSSLLSYTNQLPSSSI